MGRDEEEVLDLINPRYVGIDMRVRWQYQYSYQVMQLSGNFLDTLLVTKTHRSKATFLDEHL